MRLIDADKLPYKLGVYESGQQMIYVDSKDIDKAPEAFSYRWIPVSERLPEDDRTVLVVATRHKSFTARYNPKTKRWGCSHTVKITHWMPLPEPPKEEHHE